MFSSTSRTPLRSCWPRPPGRFSREKVTHWNNNKYNPLTHRDAPAPLGRPPNAVSHFATYFQEVEIGTNVIGREFSQVDAPQTRAAASPVHSAPAALPLLSTVVSADLPTRKQ